MDKILYELFNQSLRFTALVTLDIQTIPNRGLQQTMQHTF